MDTKYFMQLVVRHRIFCIGHRRKKAEFFLSALQVVKYLYIFGNILNSLLSAFVITMMHKLLLSVPQKLSIGALSKQFPFLLMDAFIPN